MQLLRGLIMEQALTRIVVFRRPLADPDAGDGQTAYNGGIKRGIVVQAEVAAEPDKDVSRFHEHVPTEKGETILSESASWLTVCTGLETASANGTMVLSHGWRMPSHVPTTISLAAR